MSKLRFFEEDKICIGTITRENIKISGARDDETEGFIDFIMGIDSVEVGASIMELENKTFKISLRGKTANVKEIAAVFGGGGHILASGCRMQGEYEEVIDKLVFAIKQRLPE